MKNTAKTTFVIFFAAIAMTMTGCSETTLVEAEDTTEWANTARAFRGELGNGECYPPDPNAVLVDCTREIDGLNFDNGWLNGDAQ